MKVSFYLALFIAFTFLQACDRICKNELKEKFQTDVSYEDNLTITEISKTNKIKEQTWEYQLGYDKNNRLIYYDNREFTEYDKNGRIAKTYKCDPVRDPCCKYPHVLLYKYLNGKIDKIYEISRLMKDTVMIEKYVYDDQKRLIFKYVNGEDSYIYSYIGNDTNPAKEKDYFSVVGGSSAKKKVSGIKTTSFEYDSHGRKILESWKDNDGAYKISRLFYDSKNRLKILKDSSLNKGQDPNIYNLYWIEYQYDEKDRIIERYDGSGPIIKPATYYIYKTKYEYKRE